MQIFDMYDRFQLQCIGKRYCSRFIKFWHEHFDIPRPLFRTIAKTYTIKLKNRPRDSLLLFHYEKLQSECDSRIYCLRAIQFSQNHFHIPRQIFAQLKRTKKLNFGSLEAQIWDTIIYNTLQKILRKKNILWKYFKPINILFMKKRNNMYTYISIFWQQVFFISTFD